MIYLNKYNLKFNSSIIKSKHYIAAHKYLAPIEEISLDL